MCGSRVAVANAEHRLGHDVLRDRAEKLLRRLVLLARPLVPRLPACAGVRVAAGAVVPLVRDWHRRRPCSCCLAGAAAIVAESLGYRAMIGLRLNRNGSGRDCELRPQAEIAAL